MINVIAFQADLELAPDLRDWLELWKAEPRNARTLLMAACITSDVSSSSGSRLLEDLQAHASRMDYDFKVKFGHAESAAIQNDEDEFQPTV